MVDIYFYSGATDKLLVTCRLCAKALAQNARVMIFTTDSALLEKLDKLLWTYQQTSFLPHCLFHEDENLVESTPIVLSDRISFAPGFSILINLHTQCPADFDQFERVIEITGLSPEDKSLARERYRFYRQAGYALHHYDLADR